MTYLIFKTNQFNSINLLIYFSVEIPEKETNNNIEVQIKQEKIDAYSENVELFESLDFDKIAPPAMRKLSGDSCFQEFDAFNSNSQATISSIAEDGLNIKCEVESFCDNDSAHGSSIQEAGKYLKGEIVWGSLNFLKFWPCLIYADESEDTIDSKKI